MGVYGFAQHQSNFFNNVFTDCGTSCQNFGPSSAAVTGGLGEVFVSDRFKVTSWLTLIAGVRYSHFDSGSVSGGTQPAIVENATDPRFGIAIRVPRLNWVFHGFYGHFYQAPPLLTATGPLLTLAVQPDSGVRPLARRARSRIPIRRVDSLSRLGARGRHVSNPRDELAGPQQYRRIEHLLAAHLGLGIDSRLGNHAAFPAHLASRAGPRGLFESDRAGDLAFHRRPDLPTPVPAGCEPPPGLSPVDHDQRNTLNMGVNSILPWRVSLRRMCTTARDSPTGCRTRNIRGTICRSTRRLTFPWERVLARGTNTGSR